MSEAPWETLAPDAPDLFARLRRHERCEVLVRFSIGERRGMRVEIPAVRTVLQGRLEAHPRVDRFRVWIDGWSEGDRAWLARRKGRGGPDYWQGAVEYRPHGKPALVLYFTAPLDGLEIQVLLPANPTNQRGHCEDG